MLADQVAFGREEKHGAVERPAVALDDPDQQSDPVLARDLPEECGRRRRHLDGALEIAPELFPALREPHPDAGAEVEPLGVGRDEGFREHHQLGAAARGIGREVRRFFETGLAVVRHRPGLDHGHDSGRHDLSLPCDAILAAAPCGVIPGGHDVTIIQLPSHFQFAGHPVDSGPPRRVASQKKVM